MPDQRPKCEIKVYRDPMELATCAHCRRGGGLFVEFSFRDRPGLFPTMAPVRLTVHVDCIVGLVPASEKKIRAIDGFFYYRIEPKTEEGDGHA